MGSVDQLGIKPLKKYGLSFPSKMDHQFNEKSVRKLEQQNKELIKVLFDLAILTDPGVDFTSRDCERLLEKLDTYNRPWDELKELT